MASSLPESSQPATALYRAEVDVADGRSLTRTLTGTGPVGVPADQVTDGAVAAVRAQEPTSRIEAARSRTIKP
ncbi:hypothetical protein ABT093_40535 [Kitasatospora sp. NPDC002551]|uniref:hypothetical protein n=1 Tax=Kitasatospora sp. NPDC002551 TaxID=3154539 RepID=UPI00332F48FA